MNDYTKWMIRWNKAKSEVIREALLDRYKGRLKVSVRNGVTNSTILDLNNHTQDTSDSHSNPKQP